MSGPPRESTSGAPGPAAVEASSSKSRAGFSPAVLVSAGAAGVVSRSFIHPFDTLRACMQVQREKIALRELARNLIRAEGLVGLYRGYSLALGFTPFASATFFGTYELAKKHLGEDADHNAFTYLASGLCAEVVSGVLWVPMDVSKQRMQVRAGPEYYKASTTLQAIVEQNGFRGLFRGYLACLSSFGPQTAIYFTSYEYLKRGAIKMWGDQPPATVFFGCAAVASTAAAALTNPLDVVKTRLQVQNNRGWWSIAIGMLREEGIQSFAKGISARCLQAAPGGSLSMGSFEFFKRKLTD